MNLKDRRLAVINKVVANTGSFTFDFQLTI
jgi:hypothetical protein